MTLISTVDRVDYLGAGSVGPFAVPFRFLSSADLRVIQVSAAGGETVLVLTTDYTVAGALDATGTVTLTTALPVGASLTIRRAPALTQPASFRNQAAYAASTHEDEFDRVVMQLQSLKDQVDRAFGIVESLDPAAHSLLLRPETGKVLAWQSSTELGNSTLDSSATALPGAGRTVATLSAYLLNNAVYNVKDYGALGNGIANDSAACQACIDAAGANALIFFPAGTFKLVTGLTISHDRVYLVGQGIYATELLFAPTAGGGTCILIQKAGPSETAQGGIRDLAIYSNDTTRFKIGINPVAVSNYRVENVIISGNPGWTGADSIGLQTNGHELSTFKALTIKADHPIWITGNPVDPSIDIDHFHFQDLYLIAIVGACVRIVPNVNLTNVTFDGHQAWVAGTHGLYWDDNLSAGASVRLTLRNIRWEQCINAVGSYLVYIAHNYNLQGLVIENCYGGADRNGGIFLRKVENVSLRDLYYTGPIGATALDVNATVKRITIDNCFWQAQTVASLVGQRLIFGSPLNPNNAPLPTTAFYDESANALAEPSFPAIRIAGPALPRAGTDLILGNTHQATVGAAGGAAALPATPLGFAIGYIGATQVVFPYYLP